MLTCARLYALARVRVRVNEREAGGRRGERAHGVATAMTAKSTQNHGECYPSPDSENTRARAQGGDNALRHVVAVPILPGEPVNI